MSKKKQKPGQIRATASAMEAMKHIAQQLFDKYHQEHLDRRIRQPSMKIAIDYLLVCGSYIGDINIPEQNQQNNIYLAMGGT